MSLGRLLALCAGAAAAATAAAAADGAADGIVWTDALALGLAGRAYAPEPGPDLAYARLPAAAEPDVSPAQWYWAGSSAGLYVQFSTSAVSISVNYTLRWVNQTIWAAAAPMGCVGDPPMPRGAARICARMRASGACERECARRYSGADLYAWDGAGAWRWVASVEAGLSAAAAAGSPIVVQARARAWRYAFAYMGVCVSLCGGGRARRAGAAVREHERVCDALPAAPAEPQRRPRGRRRRASGRPRAGAGHGLERDGGGALRGLLRGTGRAHGPPGVHVCEPALGTAAWAYREQPRLLWGGVQARGGVG